VQRVSIFLPDVVGGVESVIRNLVQGMPQHTITAELILYANTAAPRKRSELALEKVACKRFEFHSQDNLFNVARRLRNAMNANSTIVVATDYVELAMLQIERPLSKVVFLVLGDFEHYYQLAVSNEKIIDSFIAISDEIYGNLCRLLPHRKSTIRKLYFPTPAIEHLYLANTKDVLRLIFVGRLDKSKNPLLLPAIDDALIRKGIMVEWTIVGDGEERGVLQEQVSHRHNFTFMGFVSNSALHDLYRRHDIFLMTSLSEGLPVSLVEAMKTGLVPVVSDIPGGIREIVNAGNNGYLCDPQKASAFADAIAVFNNDRQLLSSFSAAASKDASEKFHPVKCSMNYWNCITDLQEVMEQKVYGFKGSFLDRRFLPNAVVRFIRSFTKSKK
jgi:glycosyltransferase involved in cell wall biosynthesis